MFPQLLLALAALAWLVAAFTYNLDAATSGGIVLMLLGLGTAAWAARDAETRRTWTSAGLAAAFAGILLFLGPGLGDLASPGQTASHLFALGLGLALAGSFAARAWLPRAGWAVCALGALLWVYADLDSLAWQPGNLSALVGASWLALVPPQD